MNNSWRLRSEQLSFRTSARLIKCKPQLRDERGIAPPRDQAVRVGDGIGAAAGRGTGITGEDEAILLREIGVVVAQVEVEALPRESHTRVPVEVSGQRKAAQLHRLIAEPEVARAAGQRSADP